MIFAYFSIFFRRYLSHLLVDFDQGLQPLLIYPPTHWVFGVGGQLKNPEKPTFV